MIPKIPVAISACLLGEPVRYDGGHKLYLPLADRLRRHFTLVGICPEVAIGLGVPRPPIQLVKNTDGVQAVGVNDSTLNVTALLENYAAEVASRATEIYGYVFKARSPSCGLGSAPLFDTQGQQLATVNGIFAGAVLEAQNALPVVDEEYLLENENFSVFEEKVKNYFATLNHRTIGP